MNRTAIARLSDLADRAPEEPYAGLIQSYAADGLSRTGHHGVIDAMGVPSGELPQWDDILSSPQGRVHLLR